MKNILIGLLFYIQIPIYSQIIPIDKQKHIAAGIIIGGISATDRTAKYPFWNAVLFSTVCGVGKEFMDIGTGVPEVKDAVATTIGGVIGGAIVYSVRKRIENTSKHRKYRLRRKRGMH